MLLLSCAFFDVRLLRDWYGAIVVVVVLLLRTKATEGLHQNKLNRRSIITHTHTHTHTHKLKSNQNKKKNHSQTRWYVIELMLVDNCLVTTLTVVQGKVITFPLRSNVVRRFFYGQVSFMFFFFFFVVVVLFFLFSRCE
jgi:hypothetical protein